MGDIDGEYRGQSSPDALGARIEELATSQHGVVSRSQLLALGLSPDAIVRRQARRELIGLHRGVYAVGHRRLTYSACELAAVLACGPGAVLSHRSAARRNGLVRFAPARIEVSAARGRRGPAGIVMHRPRGLRDEERVVVDGIPVTSVARTIVDLARARELGRLVEAAERAGVLDLAAIDRVLERHPKQPGRRRLLGLLGSYRPEAAFTRSEAERRFLALCRRHGLPPPRVNLWTEGFEIDFFWPDARLAVEVDGRAFHSSTRAFHEDRRRDRALLAAGIETARVTWDDLRDPARLASELKAIRGRRRPRR